MFALNHTGAKITPSHDCRESLLLAEKGCTKHMGFVTLCRNTRLLTGYSLSDFFRWQDWQSQGKRERPPVCPCTTEHCHRIWKKKKNYFAIYAALQSQICRWEPFLQCGVPWNILLFMKHLRVWSSMKYFIVYETSPSVEFHELFYCLWNISEGHEVEGVEGCSYW